MLFREMFAAAMLIATSLATIISFSVGSEARTDTGSGKSTPILYVGRVLLRVALVCAEAKYEAMKKMAIKK